MPIFRVTRNYSYGLEAHIECDNIEEAKNFLKEQPEDVEWERAYSDEDHLDKETWDLYNEEDEDYEPIKENL